MSLRVRGSVVGTSTGGGASQVRTAVVRGRDTVADATGRRSVVIVRQLVLSPRWIMWHLFALGGMTVCGLLAVWQWQRAGSSMGSALNVGYGLQWPVFAIFFGVMWWRMLRMEAARIREQDGVPTAEVPEPGGSGPMVPESVVPESVVPESVVTARPDAPSPFRARPATAFPPPVSDANDPELAAYNRMLAELAARSDH